jgi:periplasmic protein TonB
MPQSMFQDVVCPRNDSTRRWYSLPLSFVVHTSIVIVLVVVPLVAWDTVPAPRMMMAFVSPPQLPAAPPAVQRVPSVQPVPQNHPGAAPLEPPSEIGPESGLILEPEQADIATPGMIDGLAVAVVMEPLPPPPAPAPAKPVRVGGGVTPPARTKDVSPIYPPIAQSARVQGDVIIEATIGADGRVQEARVLRSVPLLDPAALAAVRAWEYTPTLLNGQPVPVIMTVTVRFRLQ